METLKVGSPQRYQIYKDNDLPAPKHVQFK